MLSFPPTNLPLATIDLSALHLKNENVCLYQTYTQWSIAVLFLTAPRVVSPLVGPAFDIGLYIKLGEPGGGGAHF